MQLDTRCWGGEAHPEIISRHLPEEMLRAIWAGDEARVGLFLAASCTPGVAEPVLGLTPLHLASRAGSVSTVRLLLEVAGRYPESTASKPTPKAAPSDPSNPLVLYGSSD